MTGTASVWPGGGLQAVYLAALLALAVALIWSLVAVVLPAIAAWDPNREYAGLLPYVLGAYYGPGVLALAVAAIWRARPGVLRVGVTVLATVWTVYWAQFTIGTA